MSGDAVGTDVNLEEFRRDGFAVVRGVFSPDEAEAIRRDAIGEIERLEPLGLTWADEGPIGKAKHPLGDMLTFEPFRRVLLHKRLLAVVGQVLGGTPAFWGESSVVVGSFGGARAWHTDAYHTNVSKGPVYPMVRCGIYLQDITDFSGGLLVRPGTHLREPRFPPKLARLDTTMMYAGSHCKQVDSRPGDLVIWDMRLVHAGEALRAKFAPNLGLPITVQNRLPASACLPEQRERVVMFPTFGLPGADMDSWLDYQRGQAYMQKIWKASRFSQDVWSQAEAAGLTLVRPIPEYGTPLD